MDAFSGIRNKWQCVHIFLGVNDNGEMRYRVYPAVLWIIEWNCVRTCGRIMLLNNSKESEIMGAIYGLLCGMA